MIGAYLESLSKKRNNPKKYNHTVTRDLHVDEITLIFRRQQEFGNPLASDELRDEFIEKAFSQRPLKSSLELVGQCEFEEELKRSAKMAYSNELRTCWERLNNLSIVTNGKGRKLNLDEKRLLIEKAHSQKAVSFKTARKALKVSEGSTFNLASYRKINGDDNSWKKIVDAAEKPALIKMEGYYLIKKALEKIMPSKIYLDNFMSNSAILDELITVLAFNDDRQIIFKAASSLPISKEQLEALMPLKLSGTESLSLKAIKKILPHLEQGMFYSDAVEAAGYDHWSYQDGDF